MTSASTRLRATAIAAVLIGSAAGAPADAHHSFAMFDFSKTVTLKGEVKEFQWTNPHVILWVVGSRGDGAAPEEWTVELTSPGNLTRMGWTKRSLNPGDKVQVDFNPLRDGKHGGGFRSATLANGTVLTANQRDLDRQGAQ